jgi:HK97 family phage major capsid protein
VAKRQRPDKLGPQRRAFALRVDDVQLDAEARTARISFSSEEPVDMWYGSEILSHAPGAMRADGARQQNMPLLYNHDMDRLIGTVEGITIQNRRGYADIRFAKDEGQYGGQWAMQQFADRVLVNASFMYRVYEWIENTEDDTVTATDWEPFEISLVTVPADPTVGAGRAAQESENPVSIKPANRRGVSAVENDTAQPGDKGAAPAGGVVDLDRVRREAAEAERSRVSEIAGIATRFGLGSEFVEQHRRAGTSVADVRAAALDAVEQQQRDAEGIRAREATRVQEIEALSQRFGMDRDFVRKHVTEKTPIETVRGIVLEHVSSRGGPVRPLAPSTVDWTAREAANYSLRRAILAALNQDWKDAGFEREVSQTLIKEGKRELQNGGSFLVPTNLPFQVASAKRSRFINAMMQRAAYQVGTAAAGGNLVETELMASDFIEVLRNVTVIGQLGARFLTGLVGNINIPRQNAQTTTYWVGESVALTEAEATFDQVQLRPKTVGALSKMSRLMLMQSTPAIEQLVREDLLEVSAQAVDAAGLYGTGSGSQPTGIANTTGVGSVAFGTNGGNYDFDHMIELYAAPLVANAPQANLAFAINGKVKGYLATLKSTTGQYLWNPSGGVAGGIPSELVGYRYAVSNQLPWNLTKGTSAGICSMSMFGNWQELLIGEWGVLEIMVNPYDSTGFTTGDVSVRAFQTVDVGLRHPASFAVTSDGLTPGF